jgi:hypothetical protein
VEPGALAVVASMKAIPPSLGDSKPKASGNEHPATRRFFQTGGNPSERATLLGRWFGTNGEGCLLLEASDQKLPAPHGVGLDGLV